MGPRLLRLAPCLLAAACADGESASPGGTTTGGGLFVDVSKEAGLAPFTHDAGFSRMRYLVETMGGGVGWIDAEGDGWHDVYFVQCGRLEPDEGQPRPRNALLGNLGNGRFEDRTDASGTGDRGLGMGCAVGDTDGDGTSDLYVTNYGPNAFFANRGDGSFDERAAALGIDDGRWSVSAGFFDADRDGDLDLYVVDYLVFDAQSQQARFPTTGGVAGSYPHPDLFEGDRDRFYRNDGERFVEATVEAGFAEPIAGKGLGVAFLDVEPDGDVDLYVANDSTPNFLFLNDGSGHFTEDGVAAGVSHNEDGETEAGMGTDAGDADGDGRLDLFVTHFDYESNTLYRNASTDERVSFRDATRRSGLGPASWNQLAFGTAFLDVELDGNLDLAIANGHILDNIQEVYPGRAYAQPDQLFLGQGDGRFEDASSRAGDHFARALVGRGLALCDYDHDGDDDLLIGNSGGPLTLLENRATRAAGWIRLRLRAAPGSVPDGIGARVTLEDDGRRTVREVFGAKSYASACDPELSFRVDGPHADRLSVRWPSGTEQVVEGLEANGRYVLSEDSGEAERLP